MKNAQLWTSTGQTDYHWYSYEMKEYDESDFTETYYLVEGIIKHDTIHSLSRLKYRFTDLSEALKYYEEVHQLYPTSRLSLTKNTMQSIREVASS